MTQAVELWTLCFEDSRETAEEFFSLRGVGTLTEYSPQGELAGMASLVPVSDSLGGRGYYAYGVCVHPSFRGQGLFRKLMLRCEETAREQGASYLCLIPADAELRDTYIRMGYEIPVELCTGGREGVAIRSGSEDFSRFAQTDAEPSVEMRGLLKPFDESYSSDMKFYFPERMGEC